MGKVLVFRGKEREYEHHDKLSDLPYLSNDVKAITEALRFDWSVDSAIELCNPTDISNAIIQCQEETILIYYTGHGAVVDGVFKLVGSKDEHIDLFGTLSNIYDKYLKNKTILLVLDACHSNLAIDNLPNKYNFEVLVAVKSGTAYDEDIYQKGFFTHYFCEYLAYNKHKDIYLDDIEEYISKQKNSNKARDRQQPYYLWKNTSGGKQKSLIASSQMTKDQKNQIKQAYPNRTTLKEAMLSYIKGSVSTRFKKTKNESDYDKLLGILMHSDNKDILDCILAPTPECEKIKNEILKSRIIKSIILKIEPTSGNIIKKCHIVGWIEKDDGICEEVIDEYDIDFSNNNYKNIVPELLENILNTRERSLPLELILMLDNALYTKDFINLKMSDGRCFFNFFNISIKLLSRHKSIELYKYQWETNTLIYNTKKSEKIIDFLEVQKSDFGSACANHNNNRKCLIQTFMLKSVNFGNIFDYGIVSIIDDCGTTKSQCENHCIFDKLKNILKKRKQRTLKEHFGNKTLLDIKRESFNWVRNHHHNIHFIHDTYDDAIALQALQQNKNDIQFIGG